MCIHTQQNKEILMTITVPISAISHKDITGIYNQDFHDLFIFPLPSISTSAGCDDSVLGEVMPTYILEGSMLLIVLTKLGCCRLALTINRKHDNTKKYPMGSPGICIMFYRYIMYSRHNFMYSRHNFHFEGVVQLPHASQYQSPQLAVTPFLCLLIQRNAEPKVARQQS